MCASGLCVCVLSQGGRGVRVCVCLSVCVCVLPQDGRSVRVCVLPQGGRGGRYLGVCGPSDTLTSHTSETRYVHRQSRKAPSHSQHCTSTRNNLPLEIHCRYSRDRHTGHPHNSRRKIFRKQRMLYTEYNSLYILYYMMSIFHVQ